MLKIALFLLVTLHCSAQVHQLDDVHQVSIPHVLYQGATAGECTDAFVRVPEVFELHGEQGVSIEVGNVKEVRLMVFDRKGIKLFETQISVLYNPQTDVKEGVKRRFVDSGWNGHSQGQKLPQGLYAYTLQAVCIDDKKMKGNGMMEIKW